MRESPLIIIWLDNLGLFYPLIGELGLTDIAAAFKGGTVVRNLISTVPSITEAAEVAVKAGCSLNQLPVLGEVTFDRTTQRYFNLKQTDFDTETGTLTRVEGAPKLADFVGPALAKRLIPNLGFTTCQIGWKLRQVGDGRVLSLESEEEIRLEYTASYDIIPLRIQTLLQAMQDYQADLYLLNISGDNIVHDQGLARQVAFIRKLVEATLSTVDGGFLYRLTWGKDPLGLDEIMGRVVSAREMLERTYYKPFPYPRQWLELLQAPCCGDVMIGVDKYAFFWDKLWVITSHGGPSRDEVGASLLAIGPQNPGTAIFYGRQLVRGSVGHLYSSLCQILYGRPPDLLQPAADLLFGTL
jgi:hypothetical protein